jgi:hypothetical protein
MQLNTLLPNIIADNELHARWLNTLSLMENTGARKISASEDPTTVTYIILKHAAEEHRHAFYLKKQIEKTGEAFCQLMPPNTCWHPHTVNTILINWMLMFAVT